MSWYNKTLGDLYSILDSSSDGLSSAEAAKRLTEYGPNELAVSKQPLWKTIIEPFNNVFVAVLGAAAFISLLSHELLDSTIILVIILINAVIFYTQQYATNRVLRSLKKHTIGVVDVIRDGNLSKISTVQLVPGDIIVLGEGVKVPADARITRNDNLQVNESSLTGESIPIHKHAATLSSIKQIFEQDNMVFQGTYVLSGSATALVVDTGSKTEFGKIASLAGQDQSKSPVQTKIDSLISMLIKIIACAAAVVFLLALSRDIPTREALRFVLSLSVSAVPEGLPVALTVIIVLGMRRMAKKQALVRSFKAIEDIGLITTIATDKTGTLTKNHLTVTGWWSQDKQSDLAKTAALTLGEKQLLTDPLDKAIAENAVPYPLPSKVYTFDTALRLSGAYHQHDETIYLKGSPEHMLQLADINSSQKHDAESAMHEFTAKGFRVIALGSVKLTGNPPDTLANIQKSAVTFKGFVAFADELRPESAAAIRAAQAAGISVRMITGDHFETAYNIGKTLGLAKHTDQVIIGADLPEDDTALPKAIVQKTVFARILPEDKFRILKALKQTEITAMTGDGVNDVPALSNAHVGIAMGSGSDIAKDAGGIVLLNDNFETIVKAIAEGRKIYNNIRKMLFYLLSTSLGEVMTMIGALVLGLPLPVTAIQILWINLVTDTALVLPLGLEPEEEGHMEKPPRRPNEPLLNKILLTRMVLVASTMAIATLIIVFRLKSLGYDVHQIQTVAFMSLVVAQWMNAFNARSEYSSSITRIKRVNHSMLIGFLVALTLQLAVLFGPLGGFLNIQTVPLNTLLASVISMAMAVLLVVEVQKLFIRKFSASQA